MLQTTPTRVFGFLFAILAMVSIGSAQFDLVCIEPYNREAAPMCNSTELQSFLPAKVCSYNGAGSAPDFSFYCSEYVFDVWRNSCPKKNVAVEDFCGQGGTGCLFPACTTAADCNIQQPSTQIPCYECCQSCFEDDVCNGYVQQGYFAPKDSNNCTACSTKCENGYTESTDFCNCYSGFTNNLETPNRLCSVPPPSSCLPLSETSPMENSVFPSISNLQAQRNTIRLSVNSSFVSGRRTLIEFPNSDCNLINHPEYYNKTVVGCSDVHSLEIPFADCGFTKTTENDNDIYRGVMHVKHIDMITVDGESVERVVDTPFTIAVRLPNSLAVQTSVEIATPVATAVKAAFIGQTVDAATQTGQLTFLASAPASLVILSGRVTSAPSGVNAALRFIDQNCRENSTAGFCQQRLAIDLSIANCDISGLYTIQIQVACSNQQNCPIGFEGTVNATLLASITAQRTCGEAFVDVGLSGSLQAFSDQSFTNQALSFNFGKRSHFLVSTSADREVVIASVTLDSVYYSGPNVLGRFLFTNGSVSTLAAQSNFTWGQYSSSQAWFAFDVTVSRPDSNETTLFKLNNDESGVYNLMALVSVEWIEDGTNVKKRMTFSARSFNQGSQFTSQVQISNTKQEDYKATSMSSIIAASASTFGLVLLALF